MKDVINKSAKVVRTNYELKQFNITGVIKKNLKKFIFFGQSNPDLWYSKKYFIWLYVLRYPFIPTNPLLAAMRFISFFFFFLIFVCYSSPKPQNMEIYFLCKVVELQMQLFLLKFFGATPPGTPPKWGPKNQFF